MPAPRPTTAMNPNWSLLLGVILLGAALKDVLGRIVHSRLAVAAHHPSLTGIVLVGGLVKVAIGRIGSSARGLPAGQ